MTETVGKYEVTIRDSYTLVEPLSPRCKLKEARYIKGEKDYGGIPGYVLDYIARKRRYLGTIYLIHFDSPYKHARHYLGFSATIDKRLLQHKAGRGARLMQVVESVGITWRLARTWDGDRYLERRLKRTKNVPRLCPICNPNCT